MLKLDKKPKAEKIDKEIKKKQGRIQGSISRVLLGRNVGAIQTTIQLTDIVTCRVVCS